MYLVHLIEVFNLVFFRLILPAIILFSSYGMGIAQNVINVGFENIGIDDGLLTDKIYGFEQDEKGFIWIASYNGLDRYDGTRIVHYTSSPNDSTTIPSSLVKKIAISPGNILWIVTNSGELARYNPLSDNFSTLKWKNKNGQNLIITNICPDQEDALWISTTNGGLLRLNINNGRLTEIPIKGHQDMPIYTVYQGHQNLFMDTGDPSSFLEYNLQTKQSRVVRLSDTPLDRTAFFFAKSFFQDSVGILWVGTIGRGLYRVEDNHVTWYSRDNNKLSGNIVSSIIEYDKEHLWIGTDDGGITILNKNGSVVKFLKAEHEDPFSLAVNNVECLFKDRQGIIWVGTYGGGIDRFDPNKYLFSKVMTYPHNPQTISNDFVLSFLEDSDGEVWIGTDGGGINKLIEHGRYEHFFNNVNDPNSLSGNVILNMEEDEHHQIWAGTFGRGISVYNKQNGKFTRYHTGSQVNLKYNTAWDIIKDRDGTIWVGQEEGNIARFNQTSGQFEYLENKAPNKAALYTRALFEDSEGIIWCSFLDNGLWRVDKQNMRIEKVDAGALNNFSANHIIEDRDGRLWLASEHYGLVELLKEKNNKQLSYRIIPLIDEPSAILFARAIIEDNDGNLWVSSDQGIFRYNKTSGLSEHYSIENGLQSNQFSFGANLKAKDGTFYFGGTKGYTYFDPKDIGQISIAQNIEITNFTIFDRSVPVTTDGVLNQSIIETKKITLDHTQSTVGFEFSELNFTGSTEKRFCYILEGFDEEWFINRLETYIRYTNLSPGQYTFKVRPTENNQCLPHKETSLSITVLPPWWEYWWFKIVALASSVFLIVLVFQIRLKMIRKRNQKLEKTVKERTEELLIINDQLTKNNKIIIRAQNELYASEKMASLGNLMAGIAHEINNPLNFIKGGMNALNDGQEELVEYCKTKIDNQHEKTDNLQTLQMMKKVSTNINNGISRIMNIVEGLRIFTRSGKDETEYINIHQNIDATLIILEHSYKHLAEIITRYGPLPEINCNPGKLNQAFNNLVTNSIHALEDKFKNEKSGKIIISTEYLEKKGQIILSFADNGNGIPEEVKSTLFEPFVTTKPQGKGTGLGLSLTYTIIEEHKGSINYSRETMVVDKQEEEFTVFRVVLPVDG